MLVGTSRAEVAKFVYRIHCGLDDYGSILGRHVVYISL
jgi:hypothetical protein